MTYVLEEVALNNTLSWSEGSMRLRPEWPSRDRRYNITPEESVQQWYIFLFPPPPAMLFFHLSSDQWWQYKKCFWRLSLFLQNSIAPSFSRGRFAWRRRRINFFDTSNSESECSPGSTSVQVLFPVGTFLGKTRQVLVFVVLLWPLIGLRNHSHSISTQILRTASLKFPAHCCSNSWQICLSSRRTHSSHSAAWERTRRRIRLFHFFSPRINIGAETAIVFFRTLPVGFPLPTISKNSLFTLFCPLILDQGVSFIISVSGFKNINS